jgi:hypothetical protein
VEDVIGARGDPRRFAAFLHDWNAILRRRTEAAAAAFAAVDGVAGLVLAGSVGRGEPWPLSDVDFLVVYEDGRGAEAGASLERLRLGILDVWATEGWWTGLDVGRLVFERGEVAAALGPGGPGTAALLADDRWFHSVSKGHGGRAVHDRDGLAAALAAWATANRFTPEVLRLRTARWRRDVEESVPRARALLAEGDRLPAVASLRRGASLVGIWLMESWGAHDGSLGRLGTRLARLAQERGLGDLVEGLDALCDLDADAVARRLALAPDWVLERHDRSYRARRHVGEDATRLDDARDVLRVCTQYGWRRVEGPPYPAWLAVPEAAELAARLDRLAELAGRAFVQGVS